MADVEMTAAAEEAGELLPGWTEHLSPDGITYYYHAQSGKSQWERPVAQPEPDIMKRLLPVDESTVKRVRLNSESGDLAYGNGISALGTGSGQADGSLSPNRRRAALDEKKSRLADFLASRYAMLDPNLPFGLADWVSTSQSLAELNNDSSSSVASAAQEAASKLSEGYDGVGDQATVLGRWLNLMKEPRGNGSASSLAALEIATAKIKELVKENKSIVPALNELLTKQENPPKWLLQLLEVKEWRSFFLDQVAKHPASPLLNFCLKYMVEVRGYHDEVAQSSTAVSNFAVFSRTFGEQLANLVKLCQRQQTEAISGIVNRIMELTDNPLMPHVALFCGQVLFELERSSDLLKSESARYVMAHLRQRIQTLPTKLLHRGGPRVDFPSLAAVLNKIVGGELDACSGCVEIYDCYQKDAGDREKSTPPEWPLCEREFLDRLVGGLFRPSRKMDDTVRSKACWVLATAALSPQGSRSTSSSTETTAMLSAKDELVAALLKCSSICNDSETISKVESVWDNDLRPLCEANPTCSMGVLFWSRALLMHNDFLRSHAFASGFLTIGRIAAFAAGKHPLQRPRAFGVLKLALSTRAPSGEDGSGAYLSDARLAELFESIVDAMVDLMGQGFVMPVLDHFIQNAAVLDLSLLRKFLMGLLSIAEAPFSKQFKKKVQGLLEDAPGIRAGLGGGAVFQGLKQRFIDAKVKEEDEA